ncbi:nucleoside-triphosphatase [Syntrophomonas erecta subsp. sporosyntropha]
MKNIFLTGKIQVGKSTIINRSLSNFKGSIAGFKTIPRLRVDNKRSFILQSLTADDYTDIPWICRYNNEDRLTGITETFETYGVSVLQKCLGSQPDLIIMDELGVFEAQAYRFQCMVFELLTSPLPVIGVLKAKENSFLDSIKSRNDVQVLQVTVANRSELSLLFNHIVNKFSPFEQV